MERRDALMGLSSGLLGSVGELEAMSGLGEESFETQQTTIQITTLITAQMSQKLSQ